MIYWADLESRNAAVNAFVEWDRDAAGGPGALAGLTVGVKSNIAVKGLAWTAGMDLRRDIVAEHDASVVARLRGAGATILGSLNMHEAALGATTDNPWFGRTSNPHRAGFTPGGSSGGSGAAVAAGLCDVALGTDTLGSVRIPAAYCGVYGLKPTHAALPDDGLVPLSREFDTIGPLASSLEMLDRVWRVLAAQTPSETQPFSGQILVLEGLGGVVCEPPVFAAYAATTAKLPKPQSLALPPLASVRAAAFVESALELANYLGPDRRSDRLSTELRWLLEYAEQAERDRPLLSATREALIAALGDDNVLLLPTAPQAAFEHGRRAPSNQADFTCLANVAGLPALAIPVAGAAHDLPVGVQLVGPAGSEHRLLALAATLNFQGDPPCAL